MKRPILDIIIDSREQQPYDFPNHRTVVKALPAGDYSLAGFETQLAVERKSISDYISTVVKGKDRFERELEKLKSYRFKWVVIEGNARDIREGNYDHSMVKISSLIGITTALSADYGIPFLFYNDRETCRIWTEAHLLRAFNRLTKK